MVGLWGRSAFAGGFRRKSLCARRFGGCSLSVALLGGGLIATPARAQAGETGPAAAAQGSGSDQVSVQAQSASPREGAAQDADEEPQIESDKEALERTQAQLEALQRRVDALEKEQSKERVPSEEGSDSEQQPADAGETARVVTTAKDEAEFEHTVKDRVLPSYENHRYDIVPREHLPDVLRSFQFHGYLRSGVGFTTKGGDQETFKAPGAHTKYRLGNEDDTYGELVLANDWFDRNTRKDPTGPGFKTQVRLGFTTNQSAPYRDDDTFWLLEAFGILGGVVQSQPTLKFWAGERFYRRHDVHIVDFFWLNTSSYGGGMEDLDLGFAKLSVAYLGSSTPQSVEGFGGPFQHNVDTRLSEIKIGETELTFWNMTSVFPRGILPNGQSPGDVVGTAFGALHRISDVWGGDNKASVQYGVGPAASFAPNGIENGGSGAWTLRLIDQLTVQPLPHVSGQAVVIYEERRSAPPQQDVGERVSWFSAGLRPVYHFTRSLGAQVEVGMDYTNNRAIDAEGVLLKMTGAVHVSPSAEFWSRPQVRAFLTHARWTNEFEGLVGGSAFAESQAGTTLGLQMEAWW